MALLGVTDSIAPTISRRVFLQSAGATGLAIGFGWLAPTGADAALSGAEGAATGPLAPNAFIRVGTDNLVTVICKHHEMGQGNTTGLATLVADELDADWSLVRTEYAPSDPKLYNNLAFGPLQGTGGSTAIANSFLQYRSAGATARGMLVMAAAEAWHVPASEIRTSKNTLTHASGRRATYGEMAVAASRQTPPDNPPLKSAARFTFIGKDRSTPRVDSPSKCNGTAMYTGDVKLPGLLTSVIAWPPGFGAKLVSFDATDAKNVKGVTDVVEVPEGVAVVATGTWAALQGRRALRVQWDESSSKDLDSDALLARYRAQAAQPGTPFTKPTTTSAASAVKTIEAVYEFPFLAHATMEPMNCVAWLHDGMLETWSGHQFPTLDHMFAAKAAGLPMDKVKLHTLVSGGSVGRHAAFADARGAAAVVALGRQHAHGLRDGNDDGRARRRGEPRPTRVPPRAARQEPARSRRAQARGRQGGLGQAAARRRRAGHRRAQVVRFVRRAGGRSVDAQWQGQGRARGLRRRLRSARQSRLDPRADGRLHRLRAGRALLQRGRAQGRPCRTAQLRHVSVAAHPRDAACRSAHRAEHRKTHRRGRAGRAATGTCCGQCGC